MKSGKLRHKITIQQTTETQDALGQVTNTWSKFDTVRASIEPIKGREYFDSRQVNADVDSRIKIRYLTGVVPKMRALFGARIFDIKSVINLQERNREMHLMCVEEV